MIIGGLSNFKMVGKDTIKGHSLKKFSPAEGTFPQALNERPKNIPDGYEIWWVDDNGKKRKGIIRVKEKNKKED